MLLRFLAIPLDILLILMLASFAIDDKDKRSTSLKHNIIVAAIACIIFAAAVLTNNDGIYFAAFLLYLCATIYLQSYNHRIQKILITLLLCVLAFFPLNTLIFLLSALGIDLFVLSNTTVTLIGALMDCVVIAIIYFQRKRRSVTMAIRFSPAEYLLCLFIFVFTATLGEILSPSAGLITAPDSTAAGENLAGEPTGLLVAIIAVIVVFTNIIFLIMIWRSKTSEYYRRMNAQNEQYIQSELRYFELYKQTQDDVRKFRHDIKHHTAQMQELCNKEDYLQLQDYLREFSDEWEATASALYQTGDDTVDAVLNTKASAMRGAGIDFALSGAFAARLAISPFDISSIFSNALDNAIEENLRLEAASPRYIAMSIRKTSSFYVVSIENPTQDTNLVTQTQKIDKINHGWGLQSIREKAARNGGTINIMQQNDPQMKFILEVFLPF